MEEIQWCVFVRPYSVCLSSSRRDSSEVTLESIREFFPQDSLLTGMCSSFHMSAPSSFYTTLAPVSGSLWEHGKETNKSFLHKIGVSRAHSCHAPIQLKPHRVQTLSLRGIRTVR